jgi:hypothetical protein
LEHYPDDLSAINREILRAALIARVDLNDEHVLREVRQQDVAHGETPEQRARERLRGLLLQRQAGNGRVARYRSGDARAALSPPHVADAASKKGSLEAALPPSKNPEPAATGR